MTKNKQRFSKQIEIKNRKASFEYEFIDTYTAGLVLMGTEIKSIREGKANLQEAYCVIFKGEMWVRNMHISPYTQGTHTNHDEMRERKLLLNKNELKKLEVKLKDKGLAVIPTRLFISKRGFCKLNIALAKGKKLYDKRSSIKEKDIKRELEKTKL